MNNFKFATMSIVLGGMLLLSACAEKPAEVEKSEATKTVSTTATASTSAVSGSAVSIADGAAKMKHIIEEIEEGLRDKKTDEVKKEADELHEEWEEFEDAVKEKSKDLYEKAEKPLGTITAGVKVEPLDEKTLKEAIEDLEGVLKDIKALDPSAESEKEPVSIQDGVKEMKEISGEVKELLKEKNKEKLAEEVDELHEAWESFEDAVKEKSKELYDKAEAPLGAIVAGVKVDPLDDKTLNEAIDNLGKVLEDIEKLK